MLLSLFTISVFLGITSSSNERVVNRWREQYAEEENTAETQWTLVWDSRREKVTRYVNETRGRLRAAPSEDNTLHLPLYDINRLSRMTKIARSKPGQRHKVLELTDTNFFDVLNQPTNERYFEQTK